MKIQPENDSQNYDFLIIGAGGTGLAAAMYSARLGMKTQIGRASCRERV